MISNTEFGTFLLHLPSVPGCGYVIGLALLSRYRLGTVLGPRLFLEARNDLAIAHAPNHDFAGRFLLRLGSGQRAFRYLEHLRCPDGHLVAIDNSAPVAAYLGLEAKPVEVRELVLNGPDHLKPERYLRTCRCQGHHRGILQALAKVQQPLKAEPEPFHLTIEAS